MVCLVGVMMVVGGGGVDIAIINGPGGVMAVVVELCRVEGRVVAWCYRIHSPKGSISTLCVFVCGGLFGGSERVGNRGCGGGGNAHGRNCGGGNVCGVEALLPCQHESVSQAQQKCPAGCNIKW